MRSPNRIKILYVGPIPPEVGGQASGGVATHCWELATQAYKNGYEVYVCTNTSSSFTKDGVRVISLLSGSKLTRVAYSLKSYFTNRKKVKHLNFLTLREKVGIFYRAYLLKHILKSIKPDLIHVLHILDNVIFSLGAIENCPPIVVTEYGVGLLHEYGMHKMFGVRERGFLLSRVEEALGRANCVISASHFSKLSLLNTFRLPSRVKVKAILIPINVDKVPLLNREEEKKKMRLGNKKIIAFCGTHLPIERKGLDILLRTFDRDDYLRRNCKVLVITNEEAKAFAESFVKARNIDALILGPQPWESLVKFYNAADVFVMPSKQEGIGLVYYEALLAGVPVIGFFKSIEELEKVLGIYIGEKFDASKDDERSLAEKIKKVLNTDFDRQLLRKKVVDNLSWDAKFHEFDSIYKETLGERYGSGLCLREHIWY